MWKPGQLVTVKGIVCRVKRSHSGSICARCAFVNGTYCVCFDDARFFVPEDCYLERVRYKKEIKS